MREKLIFRLPSVTYQGDEACESGIKRGYVGVKDKAKLESYQCVHLWSSHKAPGLEEQMKKFPVRK